MARSRAAAQLRPRDGEYREVIAWYERELEAAAPPQDLAYEPVTVGPTWQYDNGWVLPAASLGWRNLAWAGLRLRAPRGGGPWTYTLEQARFLLWYWALDSDGEFVHHSAVLQRLKGWGKDPIAACVAATDLCSEDAAFDHWDGDVPAGRPQAAPWVQILAVSQEQTKNTMKLFPSLIPAETRLRYGIQIGKLNVWARGDEAQIEAVTSSPLAIEGGRPTLVIRSETQNWNASNGGHDMAGALEGNAAKSPTDRQARVLDICNAARDGEDSVGERVRDAYDATVGHRCARHAESLDWPDCLDCQPPRMADFGLLYDSLEAPAEAPLTAEDAPDVVRSIAGDSTWLDTRPHGRIVKSILNPSNSASESRRKWYNQRRAVEDAWLDPRQAKAAARDETLTDGDTVVMFGDGSKSDDATGLVACRVSDGLCQVLHVQQPKTGAVVDRDAVDHAVVQAMARFRVVAFWFDPSHAKDDDAEGDNRFWWPLVDEWSQRYGRRLKCHPVGSGNRAHAVAFDMASPANVAAFTAAVEQTLGEFEAGAVVFASSSWLVEHLCNARRAPGKFGVSIRKEHRESRRKIDLAVCLVGARMVRRVYQLSAKQQGTPGRGRVIVMA